MTYEEMMDLPFSKQVDLTAKLYCKVNHKMLYVSSKPSKDYFIARNYFNSPKYMIPRQHIKNIWKYLNDIGKPCNLYKLSDLANKYISECQSKVAKEQVEALNAKETNIDDYVEDFLA